MIFTVLANNEPSISLEGLNIPEFKVIWVRDKSKDKSLAKGELAYIYHMVHPKSSYFKLPEAEKQMYIIKDYLSNVKGWKEDKDVKAAMNKLQLLIETPSLRLFNAAKKTVDKLAEYFDNLEMDDKTDDEVGRVISNMFNMEKAIKALKTIESAVLQELDGEDEKVRGGLTFSEIDDIEV